MFNFTGQHILIMRLITQFEISSLTLLHNFLFLASAESLECHDIGFYDFTRGKKEAYSPLIQSIVEELVIGKMLEKEPLKLTGLGMDTYCSLASALRPFEDFVDRCFTIYMRYRDDLNLVNTVIKNHIVFRKVKPGQRLFNY